MTIKTAIEISFLIGAGLFAVGLWWLAPWVSLTVGGLLTMSGAMLAYANDHTDTHR